jgi:purine-binding chemotaxis protein CheW
MDEQKELELDQYLTFTLAEELFALNIASVKEILDQTDTTVIPNMPKFMRGVLNVRGHAIPVIDLRLKLGMTGTELTVDTCVINVEIGTEDNKSLIGVMADSVQEVVEFAPAEISPPPQMGAGVDTRFIFGMAKRGDRFVIILDIDGVVSADDLGTPVGGLDMPEGAAPTVEAQAAG